MKSSQFVLTVAVLLAAVQAAPAPVAEPEPATDTSPNNSTGQLVRRATGFWTAFDDNNCQVNGGDRAAVDKNLKCIPTANRHSFLVEGCRQHVSVIAENTYCGTIEKASYDFNPGTCYNVNTGTAWRSSFVYCID